MFFFPFFFYTPQIFHFLYPHLFLNNIIFSLFSCCNVPAMVIEASSSALFSSSVKVLDHPPVPRVSLNPSTFRLQFTGAATGWSAGAFQPTVVCLPRDQPTPAPSLPPPATPTRLLSPCRHLHNKASSPSVPLGRRRRPRCCSIVSSKRANERRRLSADLNMWPTKFVTDAL